MDQQNHNQFNNQHQQQQQQQQQQNTLFSNANLAYLLQDPTMAAAAAAVSGGHQQIQGLSNSTNNNASNSQHQQFVTMTDQTDQSLMAAAAAATGFTPSQLNAVSGLSNSNINNSTSIINNSNNLNLMDNNSLMAAAAAAGLGNITNTTDTTTQQLMDMMNQVTTAAQQQQQQQHLQQSDTANLGYNTNNLQNMTLQDLMQNSTTNSSNYVNTMASTDQQLAMAAAAAGFALPDTTTTYHPYLQQFQQQQQPSNLMTEQQQQLLQQSTSASSISSTFPLLSNNQQISFQNDNQQIQQQLQQMQQMHQMHQTMQNMNNNVNVNVNGNNVVNNDDKNIDHIFSDVDDIDDDDEIVVESELPLPLPLLDHIQIISEYPLRVKVKYTDFRNDVLFGFSRNKVKAATAKARMEMSSSSFTQLIGGSGTPGDQLAFTSPSPSATTTTSTTPIDPNKRASKRATRTKKRSYRDHEDTSSNSDTDDDDIIENNNNGTNSTPKTFTQQQQIIPKSGSKKRGRPSKKKNKNVMEDSDAPPFGILPSLWYTREAGLHIFVIEKILTWKTRPIYNYEEYAMPTLNMNQISNLSTYLIDEATKRGNWKERMDVSRIYPQHCPLVKKSLSPKPPTPSALREEIVLVKWRGFSYMHCSWERITDLIKFDTSSKTKFKRFYLQQETTYGLHWRELLEDNKNRGNETTDTTTANNKEDDNDNVVDDEDYFPRDYMEVERVLNCDETEMDLNVLYRQRATSRKAEKNDRIDGIRCSNEKQKLENCFPVPDYAWKDPQEIVLSSSSLDPTTTTATNIVTSSPSDNYTRKLDPEDTVRYVIKWRGLSTAEITWEYWKDLKYDYLIEVEDFWLRERSAPSEMEVNLYHRNNRPHPNITDFKKINESPLYGVSSIPRPMMIRNKDTGVESLSLVPEGTLFNNNTIDNDDDSKGGLRLRDYQLEGVNWLLFNWWNKRSCILADEMGLGKTIQSVCFLKQLHFMETTNIRGPFLVVAPLSLLSQWQSETSAWVPDMNIVVYHGSSLAREYLRKTQFFYTCASRVDASKLKGQHITKFHIMITSYEVILKDISVLSKIRWKALIVDEAHRLKNLKSKLFEEMVAIPRDFCLLLTGTPLQNSTEELWALLNFTDQKVFSSKDLFIEKFGQLTDSDQVKDLHALLKPYLLRRVKEDVEKALPPKEETIIEVSLTPLQKTYYKAIYERNTAFLFRGSKPSNAPSLMNIMMELRKCCNHPFLIRGVEDRILSNAVAKIKVGGVIPPGANVFPENLVKSSGKLVLLDKLLPKLRDGGHKVLIFSQMVRVLDLLEELLQIKKYSYERLDGSTSASLRVSAVDRFHRKSCERFVMLLSTRAGGLGLNLTAADTVIIYDSDWNPQNDLQAMARAHRIGQTRAVQVYRLLTAKTYEMHMFHTASMKLGLDRAVLASQRNEEENDSKSNNKQKQKQKNDLQAKEIDELLKKGAYDVFRDDDGNEGKEFMETDIDQLLEKRAQKVTYGDNMQNPLSAGLGSFSKASFVVATGAADGVKDVDLDDPNFWTTVGLEAPVAEITNDVEPDGKKRSRKQVQVFDPYTSFAEADKKKKVKLAQQIKKEKEEKKRVKLEKKLKKIEDMERRKSESEERAKKEQTLSESPTPSINDDDGLYNEGDEKRGYKKRKPKIRKNTIRGNEAQLERIKQAWSIAQRNQVCSSTLRFGFGRFSKLRQESLIPNLPIQDLEVFCRSYVYLLGLQASNYLFSKYKKSNKEQSYLPKVINQIRHMTNESDIQWIIKAIQSSTEKYKSVALFESSLRNPLSLLEPTFTSELRKGAAIHGLFRLSFLSRLNAVIENALDGVLSNLGYEEVGKRGCQTKDLSSLDVDLKARHVTTEELSHSLGRYLDCVGSNSIPTPAPWWDRSCDLGLVIGTFVHGLGNYDTMQRDNDLPYNKKIRQYAAADLESSQAYYNYVLACNSVMGFYEKEEHLSKAWLDTGTMDGKRTKLLPNDVLSYGSDFQGSSENTLYKISSLMLKSIRKSSTDPFHFETEASKLKNAYSRIHSHYLPMPDSSMMDNLLVLLLDNIEANIREGREYGPKIAEEMEKIKHVAIAPQSIESRVDLKSILKINNPNPYDLKDVAVKNRDIYIKLQTNLINGIPTIFTKIGTSTTSICSSISTYKKTIFHGTLCGVKHTNLYDLSNFPIRYARIAKPSDSGTSNIYNMMPNVSFLDETDNPDNLTRVGVCGLIHSDKSTIDIMQASLAEADSAPENGDSHNKDPQASPMASISFPAALPETSTFRRNATSRILFNSLILYYGSPLLEGKEPYSIVHSSIWNSLFGNPSPSTRHEARESSSASDDFFTFDDLLTMDNFSSHFEDSHGHLLISAVECESYLNTVLLPHCLRLCLGWAPAIDENDTWSTSQSDTDSSLSPLPDPCLPLSLHSEASVTNAVAIIRRVRLIRAIRFIVGGGVPVVHLLSFLRGPTMRRNLDGLPIWWCPWIHDLAMLIYVSAHGLLAVTAKYQQQKFNQDNDPIFGNAAIQRHLRALFVDGRQGMKPALPRSFLSNSSNSNIESWLSKHAAMFPSEQILERRLALICSELTTTAASMSSQREGNAWRYDNIPMFDHCGWPIHEYTSLRSVYGCGGAPNINSSLLCSVEDEAIREGTYL